MTFLMYPKFGNAMRRKVLLFTVFIFLSGSVGAAPRTDPLSDCATHIPWGSPSVTDGAAVDLVCHAGYLAALDGRAKVPRWVAYNLNGDHTLGCLPRTGLRFQVDKLAPARDQARLQDYSHSGYDLGHMAPNQDFAWNQTEQAETFSFANVSPQLPGLNRQGWERGEEIVRAWALARGNLEVYVGPILSASDAKIGNDAVDVPNAFYKIVVDTKTGEAIGFVMPQKAIAKADIAPYIRSIKVIQALAHVNFPLPHKFSQQTTPWTVNLTTWSIAHRAACRK